MNFLYEVKLLLKNGFGHIFSANILNQILGFGSLLVVTKILLPSEIASLKIMQSYIAVALTFATLGSPSAIIKFCAEIKDIQYREYISLIF